MLLSNCWLWHIKPVERISSIYVAGPRGRKDGKREGNWSEIIKETIGKANTKKKEFSLPLTTILLSLTLPYKYAHRAFKN